MGAVDFAVVAASLLTAIGVLPNDSVLFQPASGTAELRFLSPHDAVMQEAWPYATGAIVLPHMQRPTSLRNGIAAAPPSPAGPLHLCLTSLTALDVDAVEAWFAKLQMAVPVQLHIATVADQRNEKEKQLLVRRLVSMFRKELASYVEVQLTDEDLPGLLAATDERLLILRDVCMTAVLMQKPAAGAFAMAMELSHASAAMPPIALATDGAGSWSVGVPGRPYSAIRNDVAQQNMHFAIRNNVSLVAPGGRQTGSTQLVVDAHGTWELERLRLGGAVVAGFVHGVFGQLMLLWSRSKEDLFKMSGDTSKAYALTVRVLQKQSKEAAVDLGVFVRAIDFGMDVAERNVFPLEHFACAAYELKVLEPSLVSTVVEGGQPQRKKGVLGRVVMKPSPSFEPCERQMVSGAPLQLCQPQATARLTVADPSSGAEPKPCLYCSVVPLLDKTGHCVSGGRVSLRHRKTYGSYSDYGVYPRGFDGYDVFSLLEGTVEGDSQSARLLAPSKHNPKELSDEDKVRVMPTLVPVRLKKAK